jgi:hypothetical protein
VDALRQNHDPKSASICQAHISLSEPLPAPLSINKLGKFVVRYLLSSRLRFTTGRFVAFLLILVFVTPSRQKMIFGNSVPHCIQLSPLLAFLSSMSILHLT